MGEECCDTSRFPALNDAHRTNTMLAETKRKLWKTLESQLRGIRHPEAEDENEQGPDQDDSDSQRVNWNDFLSRQRRLENERWDRVDELRAEIAPTHAPMLCKKSLQIAQKIEECGRKRSSRKPVHQT